MKPHDIDCVKIKIESIIEKSSVPEDHKHSKNTLKWVLKLKPDADEALKIAALGHDIERAIKQRKVNRSDYKSYDEFKKAHALNSANILVEIIKEYNVSEELIDEIFFLVKNHETGNGKKTDILKYADTISFFQVNLPLYFTRNSEEETKNRVSWGYKKLPEEIKIIVSEFKYENMELNLLVKKFINDGKNKLTGNLK